MNERNTVYDELKGILILLVIIGHAIQRFWGLDFDKTIFENPCFNIIYTFHMPLFIFVSGYFSIGCLKKTITEVFIKKITRLIVPAFVYSTVILLIYYFSDREFTLRGVYNTYKTYWYLICVFILSILYYFYVKGSLLVKILFIIVYILMLYFYEKLPVYVLKDCQVIRQTLIFGVGLFYRLHEEKLNVFVNTFRAIPIMCLAIIGIIINRCCWGFNLMDFPQEIRIIDGILCSYIAFVFFMFCIKHFNCDIIKSFLENVGKQSLGIYVIHVVLCKFMNYYCESLTFSWRGVLIVSVVLYCFSIIVIYFIRKVFKSKSYIFGV